MAPGSTRGVTFWQKTENPFFNGNLETAQQAIALNFYIGVTGTGVTYKTLKKSVRSFRQLPSIDCSSKRMRLFTPVLIEASAT